MKTTSLSKRILAILTVIAMLAGYFVVSAVAAEDSSIPANGYAAIGVVDPDANKAEVLLADGTQGTVYYDGAEPIANGFYTYTRDENNVYTFTDPVDVYGANPNQHYGTLAWFHCYGWFWDAASTHYYPGSNPFFVRYGDGKWSIKTLGEMTSEGGQYVFTYVFDVDGNAPGAVLLGAYNGSGIDTTGIDVVYPDAEPEYDLSAFSSDLHEDVNLENVIFDSGYAAVGAVNEAECKAEVLLANGTQGTVYFEGKAPASGAVYSYTRNVHNVYSFTTPAANFGYSNQLEAGTAWSVGYASGGWMWDSSGNVYYPGTNPIFVRFGDNQWAITVLTAFTDANAFPMSFMLDVQANPDGGYIPGAVVVGAMQADGSVNTDDFAQNLPDLTAEFDLSDFSDDLHASVDLDSIVIETGYAAVGFVDPETHEVEILKADGTQGTVYYTGTAPISGCVYTYSRLYGNLYAFEVPEEFYGADQYYHVGNPMWYTSDGWTWTYVGAESGYLYFYPNQNPIFVRYGDNCWSITTISETTNPGANYVFTYMLDVVGGTPGAVVIGGGTGNGAVETTGFDVVLAGHSATNDLNAPTQKLHENVILDNVVIKEGYAAVGSVDTDASTAIILLENGEKATVSYIGAAPLGNTVYRYIKYGSGSYAFELPIANEGNADTIADEGFMYTFPTAGGYVWGEYPALGDTPNIFFYNGDIPVFVRLSATKWAIADESLFVDTHPDCFAAYMLDVTPVEGADATYHLVNAILINGYNPDLGRNAVVHDPAFPKSEGVYLLAPGVEPEHIPSGPVIENQKDATCDVAGSYESVVYCHQCGEELSRETITVDALGHSYSYTNNGNNTHTYACSICGDATTSEHSYVDNACACGHTLVDLIKSSQATLEAMLRLDFTVDKTLLTGEDNYVVLTHTYANGTTDVVTIPQSQWSKAGMVSYSKIAAKEMGDDVTIVVYNAQGQQLSIPETDSIKAYAFRGLKALAGVADGTKNAILRTLLVDMLNYGAAAQVQFKYDTANLVNADLTDTQKAWATKNDVAPSGNHQIKDAATFNSTLVLESAIEMDCIFYASKIGAYETWSDLYAIATYTDFKGNLKTVRIEGENFRMYSNSNYALVPVIGMAVADYQAIVTCVVYDANDNALGTAIDSVESYVYRALASGAAGATLENLCKNLMKFSASANAYFK